MDKYPQLDILTFSIVLALSASVLSAQDTPVADSTQNVLPDISDGQVQVRLQLIAGGLGADQIAPTDLVPFPDGSGRLLVSQLYGQIRLIDAGRQLAETPYLNVTNPDSDFTNPFYGVTTLSFHPDFANPQALGYGKLYTLESEVVSQTFDFASPIGPAHHDSVVYEYTVDDITADVFAAAPASEKREVLRVRQPSEQHTVNDFAFAPGGSLFISIGDGKFSFANQNLRNSGTPTFQDNARDLSNVFGKIIRIDPLGSNSTNGQYGIPQDNPFLDDPQALPELFAIGFRNPYRISLDHDNPDDLYVGNVGQLSIESVYLVSPGGDHGWNLKEGSFIYNGQLTADADADDDGFNDFAQANNLIDPIFEYDHGDGRSVTGGFIYRGDNIPTLRGQYVFADFQGGSTSGNVARLFYGDPATGEMFEMLIDTAGDALPRRIFSIGEDADGELYILAGDSSDGSGVVLRIALSPVLGDMDGNGVFDAFDVAPFELALSDKQTYIDTHPGLDPDVLGDFDSSGALDAFDVAGFEAALAGITIPEPAGLAGFAVVGAILSRRRRDAAIC